MAASLITVVSSVSEESPQRAVTTTSLRDPLRVAATLGRVAPSSSRYARHLSRFNGRVYPKIGVYPPMLATPPVIAGIATLRSR